ncbi:hypothetical protein V8G54_028862 [Vigna mungo]|uniref:Uncharacterized protein n=1 Tax=Vigna mungo TaxID=3915 RepID=A0AAQ3MTD3_VIGMU
MDNQMQRGSKITGKDWRYLPLAERKVDTSKLEEHQRKTRQDGGSNGLFGRMELSWFHNESLATQDQFERFSRIPKWTEVDLVLQQFQEVFQPSEGLPPKRRPDYAIHLKEGSTIPNLQPHRNQWLIYVVLQELNQMFGQIIVWTHSTLLKGTTIPSKVKEVNKLIQRCDELSNDLSHQFLRAIDSMRMQANKHRCMEYTPYKMLWLAKRPNQKFCPRFCGPFQILDRIGQLIQTLPLTLADIMELQVQPSNVLDIKQAAMGDLKAASTLQQAFPHFHLEDKVDPFRNVLLLGT